MPSRAPRTVLILTLAFTLLATCFAGLVAEKREKSIFENEVNVTRLQIEKRLASYVDLLRGTASLLAVSPKTTRVQFTAYVEHLRIEEFYPGIRGAGYARTVAPDETGAVVEAAHLDGFSDFHFWPEETDALRTAVVYIYAAPPRTPTYSVLGYDMRSDLGRRAAMDEARDTGLPQATERITLLRGMQPDAKEEDKLPGFLIFTPIYRVGQPTDTVEQRRASLQGFVYGGFRMRDLLDAMREDFTFKSLGLEIFDGKNAAPEHLIYAREAAERSAPRLDRLATVQVAGDHTWQIRFSGHPDLDPLTPRLLVPAIAGIGLVLSLIFYSATSRLSRARAEAEQSAEDAAHNQRLFERIAATSPDILYVFDVIEQRIVYVNREIKKALGYSPEEIRSMGSELMSKMLHPEDLIIPQGQPTLESLPEGEVLPRELRLRHANGEFRWFLTRTVVFTRWPDGRIHQVLGLGTDITERRAAEAALRAANEAKDSFLATLSHELRTPLTPVLAIVSELEKNPSFDADLRSEIAMVRRNVELEARLIDDLLDLTRIARGKLALQLQPADVREIAVHCARSVVELQKKEIHLTFDWAAEDSWVLGDRSRLIQVLWNLLKNAAKFTHQGGRVTLHSRDEVAEGRGWLVIECEDNGIGISPEVLPGIFKAFEQGSREITRQFGGLGLGLAISRAIVEL
ncbi:MAG TPA: CHASE domain-containing protein, partial [Chthoniobacteraceae bacterium]